VAVAPQAQLSSSQVLTRTLTLMPSSASTVERETSHSQAHLSGNKSRSDWKLGHKHVRAFVEHVGLAMLKLGEHLSRLLDLDMRGLAREMI
jgi:hypothetical protein